MSLLWHLISSTRHLQTKGIFNLFIIWKSCHQQNHQISRQRQREGEILNMHYTTCLSKLHHHNNNRNDWESGVKTTKQSRNMLHTSSHFVDLQHHFYTKLGSDPDLSIQKWWWLAARAVKILSVEAQRQYRQVQAQARCEVWGRTSDNSDIM